VDEKNSIWLMEEFIEGECGGKCFDRTFDVEMLQLFEGEDEGFKGSVVRIQLKVSALESPISEWNLFNFASD
jgi:hypothetical protein